MIEALEEDRTTGLPPSEDWMLKDWMRDLVLRALYSDARKKQTIPKNKG